MHEGDSEEPAADRAARKTIFSSNDLPAALDDKARFTAWRDCWNAVYASAELSPMRDRPFSVNFEFIPVGAVGIGRLEGTLHHTLRSNRDVAKDGADNFCLGLHDGRTDIVTIQNSREVTLNARTAVLMTNSEPGEVRGLPETGWFTITIPRRRIIDLVPNADDLIGRGLDGTQPALRHLSRYAGFLLASNDIAGNSALRRQLETTLVDLVALAIGAGRDVARTARMRGLRAARLQQIAACIRIGFADPAFSSETLAHRVGLSRRYINDLLAESGTGFAERVMELRLQKARAMLADARNNHLRVNEIAWVCGFNEVPYFNRSFRRRFGCSPTEYRRELAR